MQYLHDVEELAPVDMAVSRGNKIAIQYGGESGDWFVEDIYELASSAWIVKRLYNDSEYNVSVRTEYNFEDGNSKKVSQEFFNLSNTSTKIARPSGFNPDINITMFSSAAEMGFLSLLPSGKGKDCGPYSLEGQ